jgi:hypothetical protein
VRLADDPDNNRALLDGLLSIFNLEYSSLGRTGRERTLGQQRYICSKKRSSQHIQCDRIVVVVVSEHGEVARGLNSKIRFVCLPEVRVKTSCKLIEGLLERDTNKKDGDQQTTAL